jgi:membrane protease subunit HflC
MTQLRPIYLILLVVVLIVLSSSVFVIEQREQGLVLQLGEPVKVVYQPGIHTKIPLVQNVVKFDKRILDLNARANEVIAADQKRLIVDAFVKFRIKDPLKFYQTVRTEAVALQRLDTFLDSSLRQVLGSVPLSALLTDKRSEVMHGIWQELEGKAQQLGIEVVDVRIMRADLPQKNSEAIFHRMQTEREREAKEFRAQGAEDGQRIRAQADKERKILLAEADKKSEIIRGDGDAQATRIFADAFSRDPDFFAFYRSMQAYRTTLGKDDTSMVLSPDSEFLKYFDKPGSKTGQ